MTDAPRPDDDMLAAEYALGLLEGEELLAARGREEIGRASCRER